MKLETWVRRIAVAATVGMFLVLIMGTTVTNTGSAEGCGRDWPLCHGTFVPEYTVQTAIEWSHRFVTGIETFLIMGAAAGALFYRRKQRGVVFLTIATVFTLFLQAGMGAAAVLWPQRAGILATHFGISLACLASIFLLTRLLYQPFGASAPANPAPVQTHSPAFRKAVWATLIAVILVAYLGAYMRHSDAAMACYRWPNCTNDAIPKIDQPVLVALAHRLAAVAATIFIASMAYIASKRKQQDPQMYRAYGLAFLCILAQSAVGGAVVITKMKLWTTLAHGGVMALMFICIADACRQVYFERPPRREERSALAPSASPAD
jgi:cytochrome c oxidase assembly protein subunit 15